MVTKSAEAQLTITDLTDKQTYIKYAPTDNINANDMASSPGNWATIYIGIKIASEEPKNKRDYDWTRLTGSKGDASTVSSSVTSYCRASNGTGSAPSGIDTSIGTSGWQSTVPETNVDYPYLWTRVVISYTNTTKTSTAYSVSSTMDSIEIDSANLIGNALDTNFLSVVQNNSDNPKTVDENVLAPIQLNEIRGWSKQAQLSGKNMASIPYYQNSRTVNGITYTNMPDGGIKVVGTASGTAYHNIDFYKDITQYAGKSIAGKLFGENSKIYMVLGCFHSDSDESYEQVSTCKPGEVGRGTLPKNAVKSRHFLFVTKGTTVNTIVYPMVVYGSDTVGDYEPYCGGIPSPNPDYPQPIVSVKGKNLLDESATIEADVDNTANKPSFLTEEGKGIGYIIPCKPNATYTLSRETLGETPRFVVASTASAPAIGTSCITIVGAEEKTMNETFTTGNDAHYLVVFLDSDKTGTKGTGYQLEEGKIATPYVPYGCLEMAVQGKNLLDFTNDNAKAESQVTKSFENGVLNFITKPYVPDARWGVYFDVQVPPSETYTVTVVGKKESSGVCGVSLGAGTTWGDNRSNDFSDEYTTVSKTKTLSSSETSMRVYIFGTGENQSVTVASVMLEKGSIATSYEPYRKSVFHVNLKPKLKNLVEDIYEYGVTSYATTPFTKTAEGNQYRTIEAHVKAGTYLFCSSLENIQVIRAYVNSGQVEINTAMESCRFTMNSDGLLSVCVEKTDSSDISEVEFFIYDDTQTKPHSLYSLPNGVHDTLISKSDNPMLVKRVEAVDLGTLAWKWTSSLSAWEADVPNAACWVDENTPAAFLLAEKYPPISCVDMAESNTVIGIAASNIEHKLFVRNGSEEEGPSGMALYELVKPEEIELKPSDLSKLLFESNGKTYFKDGFTTLSTSSVLSPFSISYKIPTVTTDMSDSSIKNLISSEEKDIILYSTTEQETLLLHGKYKINNDNSHFSILLIEKDKNKDGETPCLNYIFRSEDNKYSINEWYNIDETIKFLEDKTASDNAAVQISLVIRFSGSISLKELKLERSTSPTKWDNTLQEKIETLENQLKVTNAAVGLTSIDLAEISAYEGRIKSGLEDKDGNKVVATRFLATEALQTDAIRSSNLSAYTDADGVLRVQTNDDDPEEEFRGKFSREGSFFDLHEGQIYSKNFRVDSDGNVALRGKIIANGGLIGGFKISEDGKLETVYSDNISAGIKGSVTDSDKKILWAGVKSSPSFYVDVDGRVVATSGSLGGITINDTGIHSKTVDINNDGSFNIGNKLVFENSTLSLNGLNLSLNSFDTDIQNQIVKTKYITAENGQIIFSEVDSSKKPTGSKVILSAADGLKIQDQKNNDKVIVSNTGVIVGSKNSSYVDITDSNVGIWNSNALGIAIDSTSINFTKNAGKNLASKDKTTFFNDSDGVENGYTYSGKAGRGAGIKIAKTIFERGHSYVLSFKFQKISSDVSLTSIAGHAEGFTTNKIIINGIIVLGSQWGSGHKIEDSLDAQSCQVYLTFNGGTDDDNLYIQPQRGNYHSSDDIKMKYWDIKVEEGNEATAWTPAPQDSDRDEEPNTLSIKVDPDNYNLPTITLGDSNGGNGKSLEISDSGIVMRAGITENIVENEKTKKKITKNKQLFSIGEKGFVFGDTSAPSNSGTYFSIGKNFAYDENIGLALSMDAANLLWKSSNLKASALWEKDSQTNEDKDPINILITEHGMGFFKNQQVSDPIAYFSNNKFYVKRTQVVERQEISGFQWFVRNGSEYVTKEDGTALHNLGLKWVG